MRGSGAGAGSQTLYDILGVSRTADAAEITAAYRLAAKRTHPDAGGDPVAFMQVQAAYETLRDPARRAAYDADLASGVTDDEAEAAADATGFRSGSEAAEEVFGWDEAGADQDLHVRMAGRAERFGYPASSSRARPRNGLLVAAVFTLALLLYVLISLFASGTFGSLVAVVILVALAFRIFATGDAARSRRVLLIGAGVIVAFGLLMLIAGSGGGRWLGIVVILTAVVMYQTIEGLRRFRTGVALRKHFLRFLDEVQRMPGVTVYLVEHAQPAGRLTRVSLLEFGPGEPGGPRSLWGSWPAGALVAVDAHRRVVAATSVEGKFAADFYPTVG